MEDRDNLGRFIKGHKDFRKGTITQEQINQLLKAGEKYRFKKGEHLIRTKQHRIHISEAKKGIHTSPQTEIKKGQHLSRRTEFKKGHYPLNDETSKYEIIAQQQLKDKGYKFKIHVNLLGTPDIYIPDKNLLIFIDGCLFHNCPKCKLIPEDKTNLFYKRLRENRIRDNIITKELEKDGYNVIRIWTHDIDKKGFDIEKYIRGV